MSVLTLCNTQSLGVHVVEVDAGEWALRSSWEGEYDECEDDDDDEEEEEEEKGRGRTMQSADGEGSGVSRKQLALIYSLQLAEAYVPLSSFLPCTPP